MTGGQLRRRRQALKGMRGSPMSLQEFASAAGISWTTLSRWEREKPRTQLEARGLDPLRLKLVYDTLEDLEENGRRG